MRRLIRKYRIDVQDRATLELLPTEENIEIVDEGISSQEPPGIHIHKHTHPWSAQSKKFMRERIGYLQNTGRVRTWPTCAKIFARQTPSSVFHLL